MDSERFTIRGATGVDLDPPIGGPGSRSYAFLIDWHIRVIVALAWLLAVCLMTASACAGCCLHLSAWLNRTQPGVPSSAFVLGDFRWAFVAAGSMVLISTIRYARLPRDAGRAIAAGGK